MTRETIVILASIALACAGCRLRQEGLSEKETALADEMKRTNTLYLWWD